MNMQAVSSTSQPLCNCVGPQPGQKACPCALAKQAKFEAEMKEKYPTELDRLNLLLSGI